MESFKNFQLDEQALDEALITFAGKAYPKFGHFVILAGGAGSGKGFIGENLLGIEGKTIDVDQIKQLAMASKKFAAKVKEETGTDMKQLDLRKPENVSRIHELLGAMYRTDKKLINTFAKSVLSAAPDRKPNVIMDVTLKSMKKLKQLAEMAEELGYDKKNVHIVWIVNDVEVAKQQNASRARVVPVEILMGTHEGAANTMKEILTMGRGITKYMDGELVLAFNKFKVDATLVKGKAGGQYLKDVNYVYMKRSGKAMTSPDKMEKEIYQKIKSYVPKETLWECDDLVNAGLIESAGDLFGLSENMDEDRFTSNLSDMSPVHTYIEKVPTMRGTTWNIESKKEGKFYMTRVRDWQGNVQVSYSATNMIERKAQIKDARKEASQHSWRDLKDM